MCSLSHDTKTYCGHFPNMGCITFSSHCEEEQVGWPPLIHFIESDSRPKFQGDSEAEERKLKFLLCIPIWKNWWFKQKEQVGWPSLIHFIESDSRPKFQGDSESEEGNLKFQLSDPIWQNHWWMLKRGFDDLLQYHSFKECLDPFVGGNKNMDT